MDLATAILDILKTVALPLGIALVTARVTLGAGRQQIRAQAVERQENRDHEDQKRREECEATARVVRAETIELISDCMDQHIEAVRGGKNPTTASVTRSLFRLSTRCSAEHLADTCISYIADSARAPDPAHAVDAMLDVRRRLLGWHIGHLTREDIERLIKEEHQILMQHLVDVGQHLTAADRLR